VPKELQTAYYRVLAHTHTLSPDDEMLRILEAMGILALLTRQTPKDIAEERERFQELLARFDKSSDQAQQKMIDYILDLESRLSNLPAEIENAINPEEIAKLLGESLRQRVLQSGIQDAARALQASCTTMVKAQQELSSALRTVGDSRTGVMAQVEEANRRLTYSLEARAKAIDELLRELKSSFLRIWAPLLCGASLILGLFLGMSLQDWRDSRFTVGSAAPLTDSQLDPVPATGGRGVPVSKLKMPHHHQPSAALPGDHER
jgi:vacuolar-type H+-ATPase subunit E/Vma4